MSARRHEQQTRTSDSGHGVLDVWLLFCGAAVLKLTVAGYWSWWGVMLPFLAFLGHNAVYLLAGFLCFYWLNQEEDEEGPTTVRKHSLEGYNIAALLFFFLFLDNLLRHVEGQGWKGFWPCSGRFEVVVLCGMLSLVWWHSWCTGRGLSAA